MNAVIYAPLACAAAFAMAAGAVAQRSSPQRGAATLIAAALTVAVAADIALGVLVGARLIDVAPLAALLGWGPERAAVIPVPVPVSAAAAAAILVAAAAAWADWRATRTALWRLRALHGDAADGEMIVIRSSLAVAHALPAMGERPGRILVSDSMLRALGPAERSVLLAHERSHLRHRHDRYRRLARAAARINPLVRPVVGATEFLLERWADEDAARAVGSRRVAAEAIARAALAGTNVGARPRHAGFAVQRVADRVDALLAATPQGRLVLLVPLIVALVAALTGVAAVHELLHLFDLLRGDG